MVELMLWVVGLFVIIITFFCIQWKVCHQYKDLPPGSMGYPFIGEIGSLACEPSSPVLTFIEKRTKRYGPVFKTRILGVPVIVSTDAELNDLAFQQEGRLFQLWYPGSSRIFGSQSFSRQEGPIHKYLRNLSHTVFGLETLKQSLLSELDHAVSKTLASWNSMNTVELKEATEHMIFNVTAKRLIGYDSSRAAEDLTKPFMDFLRGILSIPLDIPGTLFHRCLQGRKKMMKLLEGIMEDRLASQTREEHPDLLNHLLSEMRKEDTKLTKEMALELILSLLFASFETTSTTLTFAVKLLTDHPHVLEELTKEHDRILSERKDGISWEEYRSMNYTSMGGYGLHEESSLVRSSSIAHRMFSYKGHEVVKEVLRLTGFFSIRKSLQDVNAKGYTIPKGWVVVLYTPSVHVNPETFPDPLSFNPSRWEDPQLGRNHFKPFGGGARLCVGMEFSKLLMAIFLHHLSTKYRWKTIKGGEMIRPTCTFPNGFHIQLFQRT